MHLRLLREHVARACLALSALSSGGAGAFQQRIDMPCRHHEAHCWREEMTER